MMEAARIVFEETEREKEEEKTKITKSYKEIKLRMNNINFFLYLFSFFYLVVIRLLFSVFNCKLVLNSFMLLFLLISCCGLLSSLFRRLLFLFPVFFMAFFYRHFLHAYFRCKNFVESSRTEVKNVSTLLLLQIDMQLPNLATFFTYQQRLLSTSREWSHMYFWYTLYNHFTFVEESASWPKACPHALVWCSYDAALRSIVRVLQV